MNSRLITGASIDREAICVAPWAPTHGRDEELFFQVEQVGLLT